MDTNALLDLSHHRADIARLKQLLLEQSQETSSSSSPPDQDHAATDSHSDDQEIEPQLMMTGMGWVKTPHHPRVYESRIDDTRSYALVRNIMPRAWRANFQRKRPGLPPIVQSSCAPAGTSEMPSTMRRITVRQPWRLKRPKNRPESVTSDLWQGVKCKMLHILGHLNR